jgi:3-hydroxybutyryl-CoA dehydrogenase
MKIVVLATDVHWEIFKNLNDVNCTRVFNIDEFLETKDADVYFNLLINSFSETYPESDKPIFINSVSHSLATLKAPKNVVRINGWDGFLEKQIWEIAGKIDPTIITIMNAMSKDYIVVPDEVGFVSARIIAMIINEAYFAKDDEVSSETEIDIAMKLGTNYPYGPFEWSKKIGLQNIYDLLVILAEQDERYTPALSMKNELEK